MSIGKTLKDLRIEKKLTQLELACLLSTTHDTISLWERFKSNPDAEQLVAIARIFDVSTDYLLGLENEFGARKTTKKVSPSGHLSKGESLWLEFYQSLPSATIIMICNMLKPMLPNLEELLTEITRTM